MEVSDQEEATKRSQGQTESDAQEIGILSHQAQLAEVTENWNENH